MEKDDGDKRRILIGRGHQNVTLGEAEVIRLLGDFDMAMLISEIHDHGWPIAKKLLPMMRGTDR